MIYSTSGLKAPAVPQLRFTRFLSHFSLMNECEVTQSCLTLCNPMDCSLPGASVHGIFQARVLQWVAISFSRGSSQPRDWTWVSRIADRHFTIWATREAQAACWGWPYIGCLQCPDLALVAPSSVLPLLMGSDDSLVPSELQLQFQPRNKSQNQALGRHLCFPERACSLCPGWPPASVLHPTIPQRVRTLLRGPGPCSTPREPPASSPDWALRPGCQLRFSPQLLEPGEVAVWEQTTSAGLC